MSETVTTETFTGKQYRVPELGRVYIFPGFAYRIDSIGDDESTPYYFALSPSRICEITKKYDGREVTTKFYSTGSELYVAGHRETPIQTVKYLIDDMVYEYDESLTVLNDIPYHSGPTISEIEGEEYIRLSNSWSHTPDITMKPEALEEGIENGEYKRLWLVWKKAHN